MYNALLPSMLETNLGPSFTQCTPSMAIGGGATTFYFIFKKTKNLM